MHSIPSPPICLGRIAPLVATYRDRCFHSIESMPAPFPAIVIAHVEERIRRAAPQPLLGEYVPLLISDILGYNQRQRALDRAVVGWLHLYYSIMMLDDVLDRPRETADGSLVIAAAYTFQRGIELVRKLGPGLDARVDEAIAATAAAGVSEIEWRGDPASAKADVALSIAHQKLAMLHVCVETMAACRRMSTARRQHLRRLVDQMSLGFQLLDDLADCHEDFVVTNWTSVSMPLADLPENTHPALLQDADVLVGFLTLKGSIQTTLSAAVDSLSQAESLLSEHGAPQGVASQYLRSLRIYGAEALESIRRSHTLEYLRKTSVGDLEAILSGDTLQLVRQLGSSTRRSLNLVAQGS